MWNRDPPPGFCDFDPDGELHLYVRHLPHWRQKGATYFVTFRLADSLPQSKMRELRFLKEQWERLHPLPRSKADLEQLAIRQMTKIEHWLDQGMGNCCLRDAKTSRIVADAMHHFDNQRYQLGCYVVMPNHVHCIVRPFDSDVDALEKILQSWKRYSAREINKLNGALGMLWQDESFDRIVRNAEHLYRAIGYTGRNARNAGLNVNDILRWVCDEWVKSGWGFSDCEA